MSWHYTNGIDCYERAKTYCMRCGKSITYADAQWTKKGTRLCVDCFDNYNQALERAEAKIVGVNG